MTSSIDLPREENLPDAAHGYRSGEELDIDPARRRDILSHSRGAVVTGVRQVVAKALGQMSEDLSSLATKKVDESEQRVLVEAAAVVGAKKAAVESAFGEHFDKIFDRQLGNNPTQAKAADNDQELALVEDSFIRDKLRRGRLVNRTKNKLDSDEVLGIRARFGALMARDWFEEDAHPAAPEFVYEALQIAIDQAGDVADVRMALLEAFEPYVSANLNSVYAKVNAQLREHQVLPRIKPRVSLTPDSGRNSAGQPAEVEQGMEHLRRATGAPNEETFILPPAGPARNSILQALANQVAEGGVQARHSAVRMLSEPKNFAVGNESEAPPEELIAALDSLQGHSDENNEQDQQTLQKITQQARGSGSPLDQLTVEIVSLIFDFLYDDPRIPAPVKTQLLRLQVVAVKAALLDRSFFASRQHPMRRLIDRASELSCDPDTDSNEGSAFVTGISDIVSTVLIEFDRDLSVFDTALERLSRLEDSEVTRRASELADLTTAAQQVEITSLAGENVRRELLSRLDEATPAFVREFIQDWWTEVMVDARVKEGEETTAVYLEIAEQLIWSVVVTRATEINRMALVLPKMIKGLNDGLGRLSTIKGQHDRFFDELMKWHTRSIQTAKARHGKGELNNDDKPSNVRLRRDGRVEFAKFVELPEELSPQESTASASVVDKLTKGQQLKLLEDGEQPIVVKLAWISPARKLFALSRFPDFARSVSRDDMIAMLEAGRLVRNNAEATIDRAIEAVGSAVEEAGAPATAAESQPA
ncbi:MAG: DUF1631 family protein [Burkholderiaceae bacterium]